MRVVYYSAYASRTGDKFARSPAGKLGPDARRRKAAIKTADDSLSRREQEVIPMRFRGEKNANQIAIEPGISVAVVTIQPWNA
jgi:DNA-directed RNA polymerase specialized sigma subunit